MSEWIRHRGSKSMPKRLEGKRFEVRHHDGVIAKYDGKGSWYWDRRGNDWDIFAYRILGDIEQPKTAIKLQAEEVGIPEPVRLVDDAKPDANGWIEWNGGYCPVADGTLVDVKFRDGRVAVGTPANEIDNRYPADASSAFWIADGGGNDITDYRLHQPQEWPEDRMDIVGQNGNDGLHYDAAPTNKYQRTIKGVTIDVYDVLAAFGVTCQARGHAIKKLLMAGLRGHKDEAQDLREAVQAIERSIDLVKK